MAECSLCRRTAPTISRELGVCRARIRTHPEAAIARAAEAHRKSRAAFGLPVAPPRHPRGASCKVCVHECRIPLHEVGYCGLRRNEAGEIKDVSAQRGKLDWYYDPLPTNCVADWVCAGCTGAGYPKYAHCPGPERGYKNLAVFFQACSFNCLFCQNWQFRLESLKPLTRPVEDLVARHPPPSFRLPPQMPGEEVQRPWPSGPIRRLPVTIGVGEVHEGMSGAGVGMKLMDLPETVQLGIQPAHIVL